MVTNVYLYDKECIKEMFSSKNEYIKKHPEKYLFTYEGEFKWNWYVIQVGGSYYRFCIGDVEGRDPANYLVEQFNYRPEKEPMSTHGDAYCPACGHVLDWEYEDGLCDCDQCHSTVEKRTFVHGDCEYSYIADYHTHLVKLFKPHKLELEKIKVLNEIQRP